MKKTLIITLILLTIAVFLPGQTQATTIAFDNSSKGEIGANSQTLTFSHTTGSGTDRILFVAVATADTSGQSGVASSVTYNGVSLTKIDSANPQVNIDVSLWYLVSPDSGTHDVVVTGSQSMGFYIKGVAMSYEGAKQTAIPDASGTQIGSGTSYSQSLTSNTENSWFVVAAQGNGDILGGTGVITRENAGSRLIGGDSGSAQVAGSYTMNFIQTNNDNRGQVMASFAPTDGSTPPPPSPMYFENAPTYSTVNNKWTMVMIPDTQHLAHANSQAYNDLIQYVVDQKTTENIGFVLHVGDIVDNGTVASQWSVADTALSGLTGQIPHLIGIGNHDYDDDAMGVVYDRLTTQFNALFSLNDIQNEGWFFDSYPTGTTENTAGGIIVDGVKYLFLNLEFDARQAAVDWADSVITASNPDRIIVSTHSYILADANSDAIHHPDGQGDGPWRYSVCNYSDDADCHSGEELWQGFISQHDNIVLVVSGHDVDENTPGATEAYARRVDTVNGKPINQHLANYQNRTGSSYADSAFLRLYEFDESANTVDVTTYNPVLSTSLTDPENQFTFSFASTPTIQEYEFLGIGAGARLILEDTDGLGCTAITTLDGVITSEIISCP